MSTEEALDAIGLDEVCRLIIGGTTLTAIASMAGVSLGSMLSWAESTPERSARVREARSLSAAAYDEKAEACIAEASDPFELAKAKELAHHYRWKASKISPKKYGDKLALGGADDLPPIKTMSDEQLMARIESLQAKINDGKTE